MGREKINMKMRYRIAGAAFATLAANLLTGNAMSDGPSKPDARGKYAEVNGLRMYYEDHGAGGVPLVLMHGGGSTIETSFGKVLGGYARTRRVIAFEQQGHGRTADVDRPFSFEQSAEDAVALLGSLGIERADFLGYSNGGHIAIEVALRRPEVVRKLVIESAMFDRSGSAPGFWESFKTAKLEDMPAELREAYVRVAPRPEDLPVYFAKSVRRMAEFKGWTPEQIRSIKAPTLVLVGDADIVHPEHAAAMFRLLPRGQLAVLPGVDHMTIVDRADLLLAIVPPFLDAPEAPR
jgi:pimeloyl-ACP methyl ester carboxylesterase